MSNKDFYRAFEDKYRGSKALIKNRIKIYLPFILKFKELYPDSFALDIGCGRGEWLELLKENGISAQGVDLDSGMLEACYELGLDVFQDNGIEFLKKQEDNSIPIISAFHVVEHISFEDLQILVKEALRVLKPGGVLILETPNPENIKVSTESFYLDPTHTKPIPSDLLSFLPEFNGYIRTKVLGLQESKELANQNVSSLMEVLEGVSPDYAVIAQKNAEVDILKLFDNAFSQDFGLSLTSLADKFEHRLLNIEAMVVEAESKVYEAKVNEALAKLSEAEAKLSEAEAKLSEAEAKVCVAEVKANEWLTKATDAEVKLSEVETKAEAKLSEAEAKATDAEAKLNEAETKTTNAEAKLNEAEAIMNEAESIMNDAEIIASEAEAKATEAEVKLSETEAKAIDAEVKAIEAEVKLTETEAKAAEAEAKAAEAEVKLNEAEAKVIDAGVKLSEVEAKAIDAEVKQSEAEAIAIDAEVRLNEAEARVSELENYTNELLNSSSWKITRPLRLIVPGLQTIKSHLANVIKQSLRYVAKLLFNFLLPRPKLSNKISSLVKRNPKLYAHLRLYISNQVIGENTDKSTIVNPQNDLTVSLSPLTKNIYMKLKETGSHE